MSRHMLVSLWLEDACPVYPQPLFKIKDMMTDSLMSGRGTDPPVYVPDKVPVGWWSTLLAAGNVKTQVCLLTTRFTCRLLPAYPLINETNEGIATYMHSTSFTRIREHTYETSFPFFSAHSTAYRKLTIKKAAEIQKALILQYKLTNKCYVQLITGLYAETHVGSSVD